MADRFSIGRALQGFGAGVRGQGQQFLQGLDDQRKQAILQDAFAVQRALENSDFQGARGLLLNRLENINRLGGDPSDTNSVLQKIDAGDIVGAHNDVSTVVEFAQAQGLLKTPQQVKPQRSIVDGQVVTIDPTTGQGTAADIAGLRPKKKPEAEQKQINALRKDIFNVTKPLRDVEVAFKKIERSGAKGTAASDISLIFNFMKINDPGSTVREGEFATAQNAAGVPDRVVNIYNRVLEGVRLSDTQRKDFISQSKTLFEAQQEGADNQIENILQQADQDQISRTRVFGGKRLEEFRKRFAGRVSLQTPTITTQAEFDALPSGTEFIEDGETFRKP